MGIPKGLYRNPSDPASPPWIVQQFNTLLAATPSTIHMALGFHASLYLPHLPIPHPRLSYSVHPNPEGGPFETLCCALETLMKSSLKLKSKDWIGYLPLDVPCPPQNFWQDLKTSQIPAESQVLLPTHLGRGGHPIFFRTRFAKTLLSLPSQHPARRLDWVIRSLADGQKFRFETECQEILLNLNTPRDWEHYQKMSREN